MMQNWNGLNELELIGNLNGHWANVMIALLEFATFNFEPPNE